LDYLNAVFYQRNKLPNEGLGFSLPFPSSQCGNNQDHVIIMGHQIRVAHTAYPCSGLPLETFARMLACKRVLAEWPIINQSMTLNNTLL